MQTRIGTRPAIAAMALVIAWTATPRAGLAQQCRRTCQAGETRDVRGCCVPKAAPKRARSTPRPARPAQPARPTAKAERPPRPAREAPDAEAPANKPREPSTARPSPPPVGKASESSPARPSPPPAGKPSESPAAKPSSLPSEPGPSEPSASKSSAPTRDAGSRTVTVPGDTSGTPPTVQESPRARDARSIHTPGSTQTETSALNREPGPPQVRGSENPSRQRLEPRPTPIPEIGEKDNPGRPQQGTSKSFDELLAEAQNAARAGLYGKARRLCGEALEKQREDATAIIVCAMAACNAGNLRWAKHYYAMASAGKKHAIYNICSAKGIDVQRGELLTSKPDGAPARKTDEPPGHKGHALPVPATPSTAQRPRTGQPPDVTTPGNLRTKTSATTRTEPIAPSRPDTDRPTDKRPKTPEPTRLQMVPSAPAAAQEPGRRWPVWMPWAVVGTGVALTGVGGWLYTSAADEYASFDKSFDERCMRGGCVDSEVPELVDQLDHARTLETTSRVVFIAGGVAVVAGAALVFLNLPNEPRSERTTARTFVVPTLGPGMVGISTSISF